jgi:hypothetical protein
MKESEEIELHHPLIEGIMGAPPAHSIAVGSGVILAIFIALMAASFFIYSPDVIRVHALAYGQTPLAVLTAPESGQIFMDENIPDRGAVRNGETLLHIKKNAVDSSIFIVATASGIVEINPLVKFRKTVSVSDTVAYIWDMEPAPMICVMNLTKPEAGKIQVGQKVRLFLPAYPSENIVETSICEKYDLPVGNQTQLIALIPDNQSQAYAFRGDIQMSAELIVGKKSLFQQLINPFRGLQK